MRLARIYIAMLVTLAPGFMFSHGAAIGWQESDAVDGFYVYLSSPTNVTKIDVGTNETYAATNLPPGDYSFMVTSYRANGSNKVESDPSEIWKTTITNDPSPPFLIITPPFVSLTTNAPAARITIMLQVSTNLLNWSPGVAVVQCDVNNGTNAFYRTFMSVQPINKTP